MFQLYIFFFYSLICIFIGSFEMKQNKTTVMSKLRKLFMQSTFLFSFKAKHLKLNIYH